ncbi:hypothetical protein Sru01_55400 [Sphaerisporangium rufum]|uniref:Uncharacterized protein n=1 Tax=Sphaerisporangium rufum TaxID=1381558 RepID=A0A919R7E7_9ACTN|nr:hypothetical protein [Sphaerisporangium rufum]GII80558.1 hypothetical protein Sru01_55400 [Sphaerisporangium rufum]
MPKREHEIWLELLKERPSLAADLVACVQPNAVPAFAKARLESADLSDYQPTEYRADSVVRLLTGDQTVMAVIVEIQLSRDKKKPWSWPAYLAGLRARLECPVVLLVISPDDAIARWCAHPIVLGHPGLVLTPLVLGPVQMPKIIDPAHAQDNPELAVLSAIIHGDGGDGEKVLAAMLQGLEHVELDQAKGYIDQVLAMLPAAAGQILEAMMSTGTREYKSDFARHYYGQGKAEGLAEGEAKGEARGEAKGEAKMLLLVLAGRGIAVPAGARARILDCTDLAQIEEWGGRAGTIDTIDDLFDEHR